MEGGASEEYDLSAENGVFKGNGVSRCLEIRESLWDALGEEWGATVSGVKALGSLDRTLATITSKISRDCLTWQQNRTSCAKCVA